MIKMHEKNNRAWSVKVTVHPECVETKVEDMNRSGCLNVSLENTLACYIEMNGKTFYIDDSTGEGIAECFDSPCCCDDAYKAKKVREPTRGGEEGVQPEQIDVLTHVYMALQGSGCLNDCLGASPTNAALAAELAVGFPFLADDDAREETND